ncbi:hypothetical protein [Brevundimonas diminuta]|uniref:phage nozzle protein n=1 Tax=Brevundimonas diminuta TaxID=293 RepID=UPI001F55CA76|nr:hypothetical protein [Brevundimonas diminuta]
MSLLVRSIPSLIGGVSQQSAQVRSPDQLEAQINGWSSIARGLSKRAPTEHVKKLMGTTPGNAHVHTINRDTAEQYVVIVANGTIKVFDTQTGAERVVNAPGGWGYLAGITDYQTEISAATVADYSFITNRTKVCGMAPLGADTQADLDYQIWLSRRNGTDANGVEFGPGTAYQYEPNPVLGSLTGTVQRFDKLPETAPEGAIYRIQGSTTSNNSPYYVRRTQGVWDECVKPGLVNAINPLTMPHALISEADGTFTFAPFSWAPRRVGDESINPNPGFIGRTIRKVFFFQNRLALIYDENTAMSVVGEFGNFWRMSQQDYLESDVIDISATSTRVSLLKDAVTFNDGILLTSDQTQFSLSFGELGVTASSLAIRPTTNYTVNTRAGLAPLGSEIYFSVDGAEFATIREYTRLAGSDATTAGDITGHVDSYIPAGVSQIVPADDLSALFVLTDGAPHKVFVHQFHWTSADEKAQVAWHEWSLGEGVRIVSSAYLRGVLHLVIQRADGLFLERLNLKAGAKSSATENQIHLDRQTVVTGVYSSVADRTEFTLPYVPDRPSFRLVRGDGFGGQRETLIDPSQYVWIDTNVVAVPGQHQQAAIVAGANYSFEFQFSTQYVRNQRNEAITTGRTQLRTFSISYADTAYFKTIVSPHGLDATVEEIVPSRLAEFTGKVLGASSLKLNQPAYHTGTYRFQVWGQNTTAIIRIVNDTHVASTFVTAEWEAQYHNRSRSS